jgi:hypothetical protein
VRRDRARRMTELLPVTRQKLAIPGRSRKNAPRSALSRPSSRFPTPPNSAGPRLPTLADIGAAFLNSRGAAPSSAVCNPCPHGDQERDPHRHGGEKDQRPRRLPIRFPWRFFWEAIRLTIGCT